MHVLKILIIKLIIIHIDSHWKIMNLFILLIDKLINLYD